MAKKDDRVIHRGIRLNDNVEGKRRSAGRVITDADELAESGVDLQALYDRGAISGTWKGVTKTTAKAKAKAE